MKKVWNNNINVRLLGFEELQGEVRARIAMHVYFPMLLGSMMCLETGG